MRGSQAGCWKKAFCITYFSNRGSLLPTTYVLSSEFGRAKADTNIITGHSHLNHATAYALSYLRLREAARRVPLSVSWIAAAGSKSRRCEGRPPNRSETAAQRQNTCVTTHSLKPFQWPHTRCTGVRPPTCPLEPQEPIEHEQSSWDILGLDATVLESLFIRFQHFSVGAVGPCTSNKTVRRDEAEECVGERTFRRFGGQCLGVVHPLTRLLMRTTG
jgi:hypothetical protein